MRVDFNRTAEDYSRYRAGLPDSFFAQLQRRGIGGPGQRILDVGTGTATAARGFALRGAQATGLDVAPNLMRAARELEGGDKVRFVQATAEATPFAAHSFDVVTAVQCWHWFERRAAAKEIRRVLRHGGTFVIATFDWLPVPGNVVQGTEELIERYNPQQEKPHIRFGLGAGVYPQWLRDVQDSGFQDVQSFSYDLDVTYSHKAWRGRIRASQGVGASLPSDAVERFDQELDALLQSRFPREPLHIPHRVFVVVSRSD